MIATGHEPTTTQGVNKHSTNLAKLLSVRLRTKWLCVRVLLQSLKLQISRLFRAKEFLDNQATIERGFTLKGVLDMMKTYNLSPLDHNIGGVVFV